MTVVRKIDHFHLFACLVLRVKPDSVAAMIATLVEAVPVVTGHANHVTWKKINITKFGGGQMTQMAMQKTKDGKVLSSIPHRGKKKRKIFSLVFSWLLWNL